MKPLSVLPFAMGCALLLHVLVLVARLPLQDMSMAAPQRINVRLENFAPELSSVSQAKPVESVTPSLPEHIERSRPQPAPKALKPPAPIPEPQTRPRPQPQPQAAADPETAATQDLAMPQPQLESVPLPAPASAPPTNHGEPFSAPPAVAPETAPAQWRPGYLHELSAWLERHKSYPLPARRRGLEGDVLVSLRLDQAGHVLASSIIQSSGHRILDEAVLRMIEQAQPFPPPPHGVVDHRESFDVQLPVKFSLRG